MNRKRNSFKETHRTVSGAEAIVSIKVEAPEAGERQIYTSIVCVAETTSCDYIRILAGRRGTTHEIDYTANVNADERCVYNETQVHIQRTEQLVIQFGGTSNGDKLAVYLRGWKEFKHVNK